MATKTVNKLHSIVLLLALALVVIVSPITALAQSGTVTTQANVGYYVHAVIPENQIDKNLTYFDLAMEPNQTQRLEVEIVNETDEEIVVDIEAISASTNTNGVIDYRTPDIRDETLEHPFSELCEVNSPAVTVPANGTARAAVTLTMPADTYDGVVLGGIVLTRRMDGSDTAPGAQDGTGTSISNVYSYVVGAKLTETDAVVNPDFELFQVAAEAVNYRPAAVHYIRNKEAAIVKGMHLTVDIYREGGNTPIASADREDIDMAPNSVMPLAVSLENGELESGTYRSVVTAEADGKTWQFEEIWVIGQGEVDEIYDLVPEGRPESGIPTWVWVLLGLLLLLLILFIILFIIFFKRRRDEEEEETDVVLRKTSGATTKTDIVTDDSDEIIAKPRDK